METTPKLGRPLTLPPEPAENDGYDNINHELIIRLNQVFEDDFKNKFVVKRKVGNGEFGTVYKAARLNSEDKIYSMKVSRSDHESQQSMSYEADVLQYVCILYEFFE